MAADLLAIFAKHPQAGHVKTRLGAALTHAFAQRAAEAFLEDTLDRFARLPVERVLVHAPTEHAAYFLALARDRYGCIEQGPGDLGERLQRFFVAARRQGHARIVAIGADSPTLPVAHVEQAFAELHTSDVVLGPAFDGGYCLIGCAKDVDLFTGIPWSTTRVLEATIDRVRSASARLALLTPWYDVDTVDDWALLRGHVQAMRAAGIDPGAPRTERLVHISPLPSGGEGPGRNEDVH